MSASDGRDEAARRLGASLIRCRSCDAFHSGFLKRGEGYCGRFDEIVAVNVKTEARVTRKRPISAAEAELRPDWCPRASVESSASPLQTDADER